MPTEHSKAALTCVVADPDFTLYVGDARDVLAELPDESVHCVVTSPPYWGLRDYGAKGQLGLEATPEEYVSRMVAVFAEVRRVLRSDGTCWLNIGDSYATTPTGSYGTKSGLNGAQTSEKYAQTIREQYTKKRNTITAGLKPKDLVGIPWRLAFALQADGWYLRSDIIWSKPNPMPESVTDRPTKAHEYLFLLTRSARYFYDADAIREPQGEASLARYAYGFNKVGKGIQENGASHTKGQGPDGGMIEVNPSGRNQRTVWEIATAPYAEAHFATFPQALVEPCIKAGCPQDGVVLDPFIGSGTTALVARKLGRRSIGIELNPDYARLAADRLSQLSLLAEEVA